MNPVRRIGVVGAGTMGSGIAQVCAVAGIETVMLDVQEAAVLRGLSTIADSLDRLLKKDKLTVDDKDGALSRISGTTSYDDLAPCDMVIEAATEKLELKLEVVRQVDALLAPEAIIATNTSSISITTLAAVTHRPAQVLGLHFFNPVPLMGLVELVRGLQTSDATIAVATALVQRLTKSPIVVKNSPGFVVNRILCPMLNEAIFALQEGLASAEDIDNGMVLGCNHPLGPLALADLVGLDVLLAVMNVMYADFNDPKYRPAPLLKEMVAAGYLGRKARRGFYHYPP